MTSASLPHSLHFHVGYGGLATGAELGYEGTCATVQGLEYGGRPLNDTYNLHMHSELESVIGPALIESRLDGRAA
jgi:hypothetical protein